MTNKKSNDVSQEKIEGSEFQLKARIGAVAHAENMVVERLLLVVDRETKVSKKEADADVWNADVAMREGQVKMREDAVTEREDAVTERENLVSDRETAISAHLQSGVGGADDVSEGEHVHTFVKGMGPGMTQLRICTVPNCGFTETVS